MTEPTARDLLGRVRTRLSDPSRWHGEAASRRGDIGQGGALDATGRQVPACDPSAVRWCVIGAVKVEAGITESVWPLPGAAGEALDLIAEASGGWLLNDGANHADVLAAIESAIAATGSTSKVIVTMYAGDAEALRPTALPTVERYAAAHGYDVVEADPPAGLPPHWGKVTALREAVQHFDLAVWIDGDAGFLDGAPDLADALPPHAFQGFAHHPHLPFDLNSWLWVLRAGPQAEAFLTAVWDHRTPPGVEVQPWELKDLKAIHHVLDRSPWLGGTVTLREWSQSTDEHQDVERYAVHVGGDQGWTDDYTSRAARLGHRLRATTPHPPSRSRAER
jgi:hypothetical protein